MDRKKSKVSLDLLRAQHGAMTRWVWRRNHGGKELSLVVDACDGSGKSGWDGRIEADAVHSAFSPPTYKKYLLWHGATSDHRPSTTIVFVPASSPPSHPPSLHPMDPISFPLSPLLVFGDTIAAKTVFLFSVSTVCSL